MRISKHIVSFDGDYFEFLEDELKSLGKSIREKFKEKVVKNYFVFGLVDVLLKKVLYGLLPFTIYCHLFFCRRGNKTAGKRDGCTKFSVDDNDLGARINREFIVTYKSICHLPASTLVDQIKINYVTLNLYYVVGDYKENHFLKTENFREIFFEVANNFFGLYVVYLQIYFRVIFNLLKPVTAELIVDKYLAESGCLKVITKKKKTKKTKKKRFLLVVLTLGLNG